MHEQLTTAEPIQCVDCGRSLDRQRDTMYVNLFQQARCQACWFKLIQPNEEEQAS